MLTRQHYIPPSVFSEEGHAGAAGIRPLREGAPTQGGSKTRAREDPPGGEGRGSRENLEPNRIMAADHHQKHGSQGWGESLWQRWLRETEGELIPQRESGGPVTPSKNALLMSDQEGGQAAQVWRAGGGQTAGLPERAGCAVLHRGRGEGGTYGVGVQLGADAPHAVAGTAGLVDRDGRAIVSVREGDMLVGIDGCPVESASIEVVEQLLLGDKSTLARLTFSSPANNHAQYDVTALRHIPIRTWDVPTLFYELDPSLADIEHLSAEPGIVERLEAARAALSSPEGDARDLLKSGHHCQATLGFRLAREGERGGSGRYVIEHVITGSSVHMEGEILEGDVLLAVDGVPVTACDDARLKALLRGADRVGSKCRLTLSRGGGGGFDVLVARSGVAYVREMERLCFLLEDHAQMIQGGRPQDALIASAQAVMDHALGMEQHRIAQEAELALRVEGALSEARGHIVAALRAVRPPDPPRGDPGGLGMERAAREAAEARAEDWERRLDVLRELVQVLRGPPSVSPNTLAKAIQGSGMGASEVVALLHEAGARRRGAGGGWAAAGGLPGGLGALLGGGGALGGALEEAEQARVRAEAEANVLRRRCESLQRQISDMSCSPSPVPPPTQGWAGPAPHAHPPPRGGSAGTGGAASPPTSPPQPPPPAPTVTPRGGRVQGSLSVVLSAEAQGATIYYTTNGSLPTPSHYEGHGPAPLQVTITRPCTLRAVCAVSGRTGPCASCDFSGGGHASPRSPPGEVPAVAGVGLLLQTGSITSHIHVQTVMPHGAAAASGAVSEGDRLVAVDGIDVDRMEFGQVLELITGPEGSSIVLTLERAGEAGARQFSVTLQRSRVQTVGIVGSSLSTSPTGGVRVSRSPSRAGSPSFSHSAAPPAAARPPLL